MRSLLLIAALLTSGQSAPATEPASDAAATAKPAAGDAKPAAKPATEPASGAAATTKPTVPPPAKPAPDVAATSTPAASATPPKPVHVESSTELEGRKAQALGIARQFMNGLLGENPRLTVSRSSFPFMLEDRLIDTPDHMLAEWVRQLHGRRVDLLTLYGIEVLTQTELEQRYGKPPPRLANFPRSSRFLYAVANVSGHAAVIALKELDEGQWLATAYTD